MSGPALGYPDWQRAFASSRFFQFPYFNSTITAEQELGPFPVANIDSIGVRCIANTGHGQLTLKWFQDEAGAFFITGDKISIRETRGFDQSVVVKGSFLRVTVSNVEPADWTLTLVLYETTRSVAVQDPATGNVLISQFNVVVGAGVTTTWDATRIMPVEAVWIVKSAGTAFSARLVALDHLGVATVLDHVIQGTPQTPRSTFLPAASMDIRYTNSSGVADTISVFLVAKPGLSGF